MAGKLYEKATRYFGKEGGWDENQLRNIVAKNPENLSPEEYKEITGNAYVAPAEEPSRTEEMQLIMMEAMADQYEEQQERELNNMEVLATIYEETLAISERM